MPDNLKRRRPQDSSRISLSQPYEVRFWTKYFNVSERTLNRVVTAVGDSVVAVEKRLQDEALAKRLFDLARKQRQRNK